MKLNKPMKFNNITNIQRQNETSTNMGIKDVGDANKKRPHLGSFLFGVFYV